MCWASCPTHLLFFFFFFFLFLASCFSLLSLLFFFSLLPACIGKLQAKAVFAIATTRLCSKATLVVIFGKKNSLSQVEGPQRACLQKFPSEIKLRFCSPAMTWRLGKGSRTGPEDRCPSAWPGVCPSSRWFLHSSHPPLFLFKHRGPRWKFQLKSTLPSRIKASPGCEYAEGIVLSSPSCLPRLAVCP